MGLNYTSANVHSGRRVRTREVGVVARAWGEHRSGGGMNERETETKYTVHGTDRSDVYNNEPVSVQSMSMHAPVQWR